MADPAGEADRGALRLDFNRRLMLQFRGSAITSDGGLLAYRELDDALGLTDTGADALADARTGKTGNAARLSLVPPPIVSFDRPFLAAKAIFCCPSRSEARSWPEIARIWEGPT